MIKRKFSYLSLILWLIFSFIVSIAALTFGILSIFNHTTVWFSSYKGKVVKIAPFALLVKVKNYGYFDDRYLYIYASNPIAKKENEVKFKDMEFYIENIYKIHSYTEYKVKEVRRHTSSFLGEGNGDICILDNEVPSISVSVKCERIEEVNKLMDFYIKVTEEITKNGKVFIKKSSGNENKSLKIIKIDNYNHITYEISSIKEFENLLVFDAGELNMYEYITDQVQYMKIENPIHL